jgi:transcriptional regulator with XRE-family HTH domain
MPIPKQNAALTDLGSRIRAIRAKNGWKITDVANMTGMAISTISKVENGRMSLTYDKLVQLARGLSLDLADILQGSTVLDKPKPPLVTARRSVNRADDSIHIVAGYYDYWYLNTDLAHKSIIPMLGETKAQSIEEFGELIKHSGEEFIFVLEGNMLVYTEFYNPITLSEGESLYIDSTMGHAYIAMNCERCRFLSVCTEDGTEKTGQIQFGATASPGATRGRKRLAKSASARVTSAEK